MGWVSKSQIERARQISVLDYILRYEHDNIKRVGSEYRLRDHRSLSVGEKGWYWHSNDSGGKSALDFLTGVRGYRLVDAVCLLLNEQSQGKDKPDQSDAKPYKHLLPLKIEPTIERLPFAIPRHHKDNNRVIAYLLSRGIDRDLILDCILRGDLYESAYRHDCVFKGKDENGKTRYAAVRSISSGFKGDAEGSDKKCSFLLPPLNADSNAIAIFESAVDSLSHQTMCKRGHIPQFDGWRLSLGGTSVLGLAYFLETHRQVTHCLICTDSDEAGDKAAMRIAELPDITSERLPPPIGTDWNEAVFAMRKAEYSQCIAAKKTGTGHESR